MDPDQLSVSFHSTHSSLVSAEAVRALSFLIEGCVNKKRTVYPLHELALWQPLHSKSGFSKISKAFSFPKLESWLRACLIGNPFGTSVCLKSGKKLAWAQQGTVKFISGHPQCLGTSKLVTVIAFCGNEFHRLIMHFEEMPSFNCPKSGSQFPGSIPSSKYCERERKFICSFSHCS